MRFLRVLLVLGGVLAGWAVMDAEPPHVTRPTAVTQEAMTTMATTTTTEPEPVTTIAPPETQPPTTVAPRAAPSGCELEGAIRATFPEDPDRAVLIAWRESRCQPDARHPEGASGVFQIMMPLHRQLVADVCGGNPDVMVFDAGCNLRVARFMYEGSGWRPWAATA